MKKFLFIIAVLTSGPVMAMDFEKEIKALKEDVVVLQRKSYDEKSGGSDAMNDGSLEEEFRDLVGKVDSLEHKIKTLSDKIDLINKDVDVRISLIENKPIAQAPAKKEAPKEKFVAKIATDAPKEVTGAKVGSDDLKPLVSKDVKVIYQQGIDAMKDKKYSLAEQKFNHVLTNFKDDKLVGNAQYWIGEIYYVNKDYKKAAVAFGKGYQIKGSNKGADSLLKLGMSMLSLKKEKEACAAFVSMATEFPKADKTILEKAKAEAKKLECK